MFTFTPLLGAQSGSPASQSLLEFEGGVKVLIDVGWDESFDVEKLRELERQVPTLSIILLTHPTPSHIAAFAHCCKNIPAFTRIPIYATTPVISLGRTLLEDLYQSTPLASSFIPASSLSETAKSYTVREDTSRIVLQPPTLEEIAGYFSLIHPLKYSQPHEPLPSPFSPPLNGLTITAYSAGHTLGGTIWHIQHGLESVVYAVDWNQAKENILAGAAWLGGAGAGGAEVIEQLRRPTALICSSRAAERVAKAGGRQKRDDTLIGLVKETIEDGGTVLIPTDSSARVLELAYLLESTWRTALSSGTENNPFKNAKLYMASRSSGATMRLARSMLEWMDESVVREFEATGSRPLAATIHGAPNARRKEDQPQTGIPFEFKCLKFLERKSQVGRVLTNPNPKVILASDASLEWGFSRDVLQGIASDRRNLVLLTDRYGRTARPGIGGNNVVGLYLWNIWEDENQGINAEEDGRTVVEGKGRSVESTTSQLAPLRDKELHTYHHYLARQRQLQNALKADGGTTLETSADVVDDGSSTTSSSTEESDSEHQGKALNVSLALSHSRHKLGLSDAELGANMLLRRKSTYDFDVRSKKGRDKLFPFVAKRRRGDDFGELIRPEEYLRAEERDEVEGEDMRNDSAKKGNTLGQKRRWDDTGAGSASVGRRSSNVANKRRKYGQRQASSNDGPATRGDQATDADVDSEESEESDYEPAEATLDGPAKALLKTETLTINSRIGYVDFSGLHDKRSLQMLIPLIRPRKLIFIGGEKDETFSLAEECRKLLATVGPSDGGGADVFTPTVGSTIDASVDTNAWFLKLSQSLVKKLQWQNVRGLSVVTVTGCLEKTPTDAELDSTETVQKKQKTTKGEEEEGQESKISAAAARTSENVVPILDVMPVNMASATRSVARPLHVGDLRLADLRKLLQSSGHTAEFRGEGSLLIDGLISVRKSATGSIELDGTPLDTPPSSKHAEAPFYTVRRKIYEGLAVVAGG